VNTIDNTAQTWRDLTEQLTPEQIERLETSKWPDAADLLDMARDFAARNLLQSALADVAAPAGTTKAGAWCADGTDTKRTVYAGRWHLGNVIVEIVGEQSADGAATWQIECREADSTYGDLNAEQARELALVLTDAAELLDRLDGTAPPFV
jgi:hypothetical protein